MGDINKPLDQHTGVCQAPNVYPTGPASNTNRIGSSCLSDLRETIDYKTGQETNATELKAAFEDMKSSVQQCLAETAKLSTKLDLSLQAILNDSRQHAQTKANFEKRLSAIEQSTRDSFQQELAKMKEELQNVLAVSLPELSESIHHHEVEMKKDIANLEAVVKDTVTVKEDGVLCNCAANVEEMICQFNCEHKEEVASMSTTFQHRLLALEGNVDLMASILSVMEGHIANMNVERKESSCLEDPEQVATGKQLSRQIESLCRAAPESDADTLTDAVSPEQRINDMSGSCSEHDPDAQERHPPNHVQPGHERGVQSNKQLLLSQGIVSTTCFPITE